MAILVAGVTIRLGRLRMAYPAFYTKRHSVRVVTAKMAVGGWQMAVKMSCLGVWHNFCIYESAPGCGPVERQGSNTIVLE